MNENIRPINNLQQIVVRTGLLYLGIKVVGALFSEPSDTINYTLYYKGKKVYHGVCYEDCLDNRMACHERTGIIPFDECVYDDPKPRSKAMNLERKRISRDQTPYNTHHR